MATELRVSFPILEDLATQAGKPWHAAVEGDTATGRTAAPAFVATDSSNALKYLKVNANQELIVADPDSDFACLDAQGTIDDGSATLAIVATLALQNDFVYRDIEVVASCYRDAKFIVEFVDDDGGGGEVVNILFQGRVGAGDFTDLIRMICKTFTAGSTGTQTLRVRAINQNALSDIDVSIAVKEVQVL